MDITKERATEIEAAWETASIAERLRLPRVSWVATTDVTYFQTPPSALELEAADRIDDLEAALGAAPGQEVGLLRDDDGFRERILEWHQKYSDWLFDHQVKASR